MPSTLNVLSNKVEDLAGKARQILKDKGAIKDDPGVAPHLETFKMTVGALVLGEHQIHPNDPEKLEFGAGLHIIGPNNPNPIHSISLIGGGIPSEEERALQAAARNHAFQTLCYPHTENAVLKLLKDKDGKLPEKLPLGGKLFFLLQGLNLREHGELITLHYDFSAGIERILKTGLQVRLGNEIGQNATANMELIAHLKGPDLVSPLPQLSFPDPFTNAILLGHLAGEQVRELPNGKLEGICVKIKEEGFLARANLQELQEHAEQTDDVRSIVRFTVEELIASAELAVANGRSSWDGWDSTSSGLRPRNDSLLWFLERSLRQIDSGQVQV